MPSVVAYHRPQTLDEAAALLGEPNRRVIGGGTVAVPEARLVSAGGVELVDLQGLGLDGVTGVGDGRIRIGAMVRVGDLIAADGVPEFLGVLARRELPSTLRHQATIGGTVGNAGPDSVLLAGLLVQDAVVEFHGADGRPLASVLADGLDGGIVTAVTIDPEEQRWAVEATGRTPADDPIVGAVGRRDPTGRVRLALTGVAPVPIEVDAEHPDVGLDPPGDFRGSAEYRRHLAMVLAGRVVARLVGAGSGSDTDEGVQA